MSRCTDRNLGRLLHAFELGQLDDEHREAFELHLLACDHCYQEASRFDAAAALLRDDPDVRELVGTAVSEAAMEVTPEPLWTRLKRFLWPDAPVLLRPALAYFLVLLLAYPAYLGLRHFQGPEVQGVPSLLLTGTRAAPERRAAVSAPLVLVFRIDGARAGSAFRVVVTSEDGEVIYENPEFLDYNERELGTLLLPAGSLEPGRYRVAVFEPGSEQAQNEYVFEAR